MIRMLETNSFRCLRTIKVGINPFEILVGANASGKSTFLDAIRFLGDLLSGGLEEAIGKRSENLSDLTWQKIGDFFELAVEIDIPHEQKRLLQNPYERCRYEVRIGVDYHTQENAILAEKVILLSEGGETVKGQKTLFPESITPPKSILTNIRKKGVKTVVNKVMGGNDNFYDETGKGWDHSFKLGHLRSALANLPEDETKFPVSTSLKRMLMYGIQSMFLDSIIMRRPSPPGQPKSLRPDGSNLPWAIESFRKNSTDYDRWIAHIRTALPDIKDIETVERPEDRHRYLQVIYSNGLRIPSWVLSDGTLRLIALTLIAFNDQPAMYLIEERNVSIEMGQIVS